MGFTTYSSETLYMHRFSVPCRGWREGNSHAVIEVVFTDEDMRDIDSVYYKEYGVNPVYQWIGNEVEWCSQGGNTIKVKNDNDYFDSSDEDAQAVEHYLINKE